MYPSISKFGFGPIGLGHFCHFCHFPTKARVRARVRVCAKGNRRTVLSVLRSCYVLVPLEFAETLKVSFCRPKRPFWR